MNLDTKDFKNGDFKNHILNEKNIPITKEFIESVFKRYGFKHKVKNLDNFQLAMVHISYLDRTTITEKTSKMLKDVIPILDNEIQNAIPLKQECYGRLEYLGDAVIHHVIADYLFNRYSNQDEGFLTKLRTKLEKAETLSNLSKKIELHKYAIVARNIEQSNGRYTNTHLTEDIFEAFIGALSLETSFEQCKSFIISIIETEIDIAELIHNDDNYKDKLMQFFHKQKTWGDPLYIEDVSKQKIVKDGCQEIRSFTSYVKTKSGSILGCGIGNSKIKAEQNAAYDSLVKLGVISNDDDSSEYYETDSNSEINSDSEYFD